MKIKLNSSIDILLWEKEDGLKEFQPNMALRHLFGFQYGSSESDKVQATVFAGVKNPLVPEWDETVQAAVKTMSHVMNNMAVASPALSLLVLGTPTVAALGIPLAMATILANEVTRPVS